MDDCGRVEVLGGDEIDAAGADGRVREDEDEGGGAALRQGGSQPPRVAEFVVAELEGHLRHEGRGGRLWRGFGGTHAGE